MVETSVKAAAYQGVKFSLFRPLLSHKKFQHSAVSTSLHITHSDDKAFASLYFHRITFYWVSLIREGERERNLECRGLKT